MAGLCAAILAAYWTALGNDFMSDDHAQIVENPGIRTVSGLTTYLHTPHMLHGWQRTLLEQAHYRPIFWFSLALDWRLWKTNPFGYHLTNLLLHMANACLLYRLLVLLFTRTPIAALATLLWALHPIQTEAVGYVSGRVIAVAAFFLLAGLLAWLRTSRLDPGPTRVLWLGITGVSFFMALLSHEIAVIYPLLVLWIEWYRGRASEPPQPIFPGRIRWSEAAMLLMPLAIYAALRLAVAPLGKDVLGRESLGGIGSRLAMVLLTLSTYLRLLLLPIRLSFDWSNSVHPPTTIADLSFWRQMAFLGAALWVAIRMRAISSPAWFGIGWFGLTLLPVSNLIPIYSVLAERYLYLSSAGFCVMLVAAVAALVERLRGTARTRASRAVLTAFVAALALAYAWRTAVRNADFRDDHTLTSATLAATPESFLAHYWFAQWYKDEGKYETAKDYLLAAIEVKPSLAPAHGTLGQVYEALGRDDLAADAYQQAVSLQPSVWLGHFKLGLLYQRHGEPDKALEAFDRAVRHKPDSTDGLNALAAARLQKGDLEAASLLIERVLALEPNSAIAHANLGVLHVRRGQPDLALRAFEAAAAADPTLATAHYNLAILYRQLGSPEQAAAALRRAEQLDPRLTRKGK